MPVMTAQLVTMLWTVTRPQKIHQHPCYCPSRHTVPRASFVYQVHYLFVILENVKMCFRLLMKDAVHKPNLKSTLVNVITQNVESPSTLCATGNHFVFQLFVGSCIYFHLKCMNENVLQSKKRKN